MELDLILRIIFGIIKNFQINVDGVEPVWPENFAVLPIDSISVRASTIDVLAALNTYRFELDTTPNFNSEFARMHTKTIEGGLLTVHPSEWVLKSSGNAAALQLQDSTVYFWRVALEDNELVWKQRSFQYIANKRGWGQDVYGQFISNFKVKDFKFDSNYFLFIIFNSL